MAGLAHVAVMLAVVGGATAFLATSLNASDPDVVHILCPEQTTGVTRDHKWITREAIRRNLRQFFLDYPPASNPSFNVPTTASLTELYHAYYGDAASPARFIKAVNTIAASNVKADSLSQTKYDPSLQADGEDLPSLQASLATRYPQILTSILKEEAYSAARSYLGLSLHSIQKFYSHSTYIEQGNRDIIEDLGLPGFTFSNIADAADDVCTPCPSSQGGCSGNVVPGMGITTGFYVYDDPAANGFLVHKPTSGGKCSHGGVLDVSAATPAEGGINKDTASPCFSPHYHLHEQAAELAVQATDHYLKVVLDAVGNEKYRRLFDLYHGSTLAISIDTTGSMQNDIDAVKLQVAQIVASTTAELYILAPFNDPGWGPGLKTDDPEEFMDAVNALRAGGGGGTLEERFWHGLQLALSMTPDYGNVFCFTDQGGNDGDLMEGDIALAQRQHNKVTVIYSNTVKDASTEAQSVEHTTGPEEYMYLADATGGLFITSDKFDIDSITPILSDGVESQDVDITMLKNLRGSQDTTLPIDDSIFNFQIRLAGTLTKAHLEDITGTTYDLMDQTSLEADPNVEVIAYSPSLKAIRWLAPRYGQWHLHTDASSTYSVVVSANSTLSFLGEFAILDTNPPHPHYQPIEGRPLTDTVYYLDVSLVGYLESGVTDVYQLEYVDKSGLWLRTIPYHGQVDDEFYIRSEPLPSEPFYIKLFGHVQSGNMFSRLLPVIMSAVDTGVGVLATAEDLSARPGETTSADFIVSNYGETSYFTVSGTDDKGYLTKVNPDRIYLKHNESGVVTAEFSVESSAVPGTTSIVTVTAMSETQTHSVNSAIANFLVLPQTTDVVSPLCSLSATPDCTGFDLNGVCEAKNWTVTATLQDSLSGLGAVYARPDGFLTDVSPFSPGTTSAVTVTYSASCCVTQVGIIGVDTQGNVGKCEIDMGVLGGYILDFEAVDAGTTWVEVCWRITPTTYDLHKYHLLIDNDFTEDIRCQEASCCHNVTYLDPCSPHNFTLTPVFSVGGVDKAGQEAFTDSFTLDDAPAAPVSASVVSATQTTAEIEWVTTNTKCVHLYQVCYRPFGFSASKVCERTSSNTYTMRGLEACAGYEVTITSLSPLGLASPDPLVLMVNTAEALPGAPKNMKVPSVTVTTAVITWEDPDDHALCIDRYLVSFKETTGRLREMEVQGVTRGLHEVTISPLDGCTNYTFEVAALSKSGNVGPFATRYGATLEIEPLPVWALELDTNNIDTVTATWDYSDKCIDHFNVCYYDDEDIGDYCEDVYENYVSISYNILACTTYHVEVRTVSPSGVMSNKTQGSVDTLDIAPGEPQNMEIIKQTPHSIDVRYDPPIYNPQCTNEYDYRIIDKDAQHTTSRQTRLDSVFLNLESCSEYEAQIRAVSKTGLASAWVSAHGATTEEMPSAVQELQLRHATMTSLDLIWFHPANNPRCVVEYRLDWSSPPGSQTITGDLTNEVNAAITGLTACTSYDITVTPVSVLGDAPPATIKATTEC